MHAPAKMIYFSPVNSILLILAALVVPLADLDEERHDSRLVTTEGTVVDILPDEVDFHYSVLLLKDGPATVPVFVKDSPDREHLVDARVRVTGTYNRLVGGLRHFSGPLISANLDEIAVVAPQPADRFDVPPLDPAAYQTPREVMRMGKRSALGRVLATWGANHLMLSVGHLPVNVTLAHGLPLPACGQTVRVAGYPETDLFRVNLARAIWRAEPDLPAPDESPKDTHPRSILAHTDGRPCINSEMHGVLIRLRGTVLSRPTGEFAPRRLLLETDGYRVAADYSSVPSAADGVTVGCEIEVTGRCLLESENWRQYDVFPQIQGLAVVVRTSDDIRVLSRPPWWTPARLLIVIAVLLAALVAIWTRNRILRHVGAVKIAERTRLAVELHDSLSQSLAGIACQVAAGGKAIADNPALASERIGTAGRMLQSCRTELRNCLFDLRSDTLEDPDFAQALRTTLAPLADSADVAVRFNVPRERLADPTAHAVLAIVRELAGNAIRHGGASAVRVAGCLDGGRVLFSVTDDGRGFDPAHCDGPLQGHFGLQGIRDRVRRLGGTFTIESAATGTKASVAIPLPGAGKESGK